MLVILMVKNQFWMVSSSSMIFLMFRWNPLIILPIHFYVRPKYTSKKSRLNMARNKQWLSKRVGLFDRRVLLRKTWPCLNVTYPWMVLYSLHMCSACHPHQHRDWPALETGYEGNKVELSHCNAENELVHCRTEYWKHKWNCSANTRNVLHCMWHKTQ
jgi:hypothetical protein